MFKCMFFSQITLLAGGALLGSTQANASSSEELTYHMTSYQQTSLKSLSVNCPLSLQHSKQGMCFAKLYYSNGKIKKATNKVVWKTNSKHLNISKTGQIKATSTLATNQLIKVTAQYTHNNTMVSKDTVITLLKK